MEQNPSWEANSSSASQEISCILWNLIFYYHFHKSLPLFPIVGHINSINSCPFYKICVKIILPALSRSLKWSLSFRFPHQNLVCSSLLPIYAICTTHLVRSAIHEALIVQFSTISSYLLPLRSEYQPQHPILIHHQPVLFSQSCTHT